MVNRCIWNSLGDDGDQLIIMMMSSGIFGEEAGMLM